MDFLDDMGVSKLSAKVFLKVNYSFKKFQSTMLRICKEKDVCLYCLNVW